MTIQLWVGGIGSGKTACAVRMMLGSPNDRYYSNICVKGARNVTAMESRMIIHKAELGQKRSGQRVYDYKLNSEYWMSAPKPMSVIIDEAHAMHDSRRAMSKPNQLMNQWLSLLRRVLGEDSRGSGDLVLITQLPFRLDVFARDMAHQVRHHLCHWVKRCDACGLSWQENSQQPEHQRQCWACGSAELVRTDFVVEVRCFQGMEAYMSWKLFGDKRYYKHYFVDDISDYFAAYETLEWTGLLSDIYA